MEGVPLSGPISCKTSSPAALENVRWKAWGGNGGSAKGTEYTICHFKVKNCLQIGKQVKLFTFFSKLLEDHQLSLNQIFNCDEIRLNFRLLPDKTLAASFQKSTDVEER